MGLDSAIFVSVFFGMPTPETIVLRSAILGSLLLFIVNAETLAQRIGFEEIDGSKVSAWSARSPSDYQGVYRFGDSESESDLVVLVTESGVFVQKRFGSFTDGGRSWIFEYRNMANARIEGRTFYAGDVKGEFAVYDDGSEKMKGLKLFDASGDGYEFGPWSHDVQNYYSGKYPEASLRPLEADALKEMTVEQLRIMRNEIFARYGHTFRAGGEMDRYFRQQQWYNPQHNDATRFLTELEKSNVQLIESIEKTK